MNDALDTVIWNALTTRQARFALGDDKAVRFHPDIGPFAALRDTSAASYQSMVPLVTGNDAVALFTVDPIDPTPELTVARRDTLFQMVWQGSSKRATAMPFTPLGRDDAAEMHALATATQPGPFGPRTVELGRYVGMRQDGRLIAMAGERMQMDGFTEVSAVCVDPAFRGRGLAAALVLDVVAAIMDRGETPFLHVFAFNHSAIALYRKLGFVEVDRGQSPYARCDIQMALTLK